MVVTPEALDNVCEQLVQGRTRQCSSWDLTRDLQSQVQRPNHCATEPHTTEIETETEIDIFSLSETVREWKCFTKWKLNTNVNRIKATLNVIVIETKLISQ